jgi:hypothetical protein
MQELWRWLLYEPLQCCGYKFCKDCLKEHLDVESFDEKGWCEYNPNYLKEEDEYEERLESLHLKEEDNEHEEESVQEKVQDRVSEADSSTVVKDLRWTRRNPPPEM